jgi:hypothetical protein
MNDPRAPIHPPYGPKHSTPFKMTPPAPPLWTANYLDETYVFPDLGCRVHITESFGKQVEIPRDWPQANLGKPA